MLRANPRRECQGGSGPLLRPTSQRETRETRTAFTHFRCRPMLEPRRRRRADSSAQQTTTANDSSRPSSRVSLSRDGTVIENDVRLTSVDVVSAAYSVRHRAMVVDGRWAVFRDWTTRADARRGNDSAKRRLATFSRYRCSDRRRSDCRCNRCRYSGSRRQRCVHGRTTTGTCATL